MVTTGVICSRVYAGHKNGFGRHYGVNGPRKRLTPTNCPVCENVFTPKVGTQKYCSTECRTRRNVDNIRNGKYFIVRASQNFCEYLRCQDIIKGLEQQIDVLTKKKEVYMKASETLKRRFTHEREEFNKKRCLDEPVEND